MRRLAAAGELTADYGCALPMWSRPGVKRVLETENDCHVFIIMALSCIVFLLIVAIIFF